MIYRILLLTLLTFPIFAQNRPNILFISIDDLRTELGCYKKDYMHTPYIDNIANNGILFEHAYCQQAVCAPSRISLMTGLRPDTTKIYTLNEPLDEYLPGINTITKHFKRNGYKTISLGKIYHHSNDDANYWDVLDSCRAAAYTKTSNKQIVSTKIETANKLKLKGTDYRKATTGPAFESNDVSDNAYGDGLITERAIYQIINRSDMPFFLGVGFRKPHLPFVAPKKYWDLYNVDEILVPSQKQPQGISKRAFTEWGELRAYDGINSTGDLSDELSKKLIHGYRACISYVDAQIGKIINTLENEGILDETIIILWSDHGWKLGEYGDWCKHTNFELDLKVPLIIKYNELKKNIRINENVELIDIFPTLADICSLPIPNVDGKSLLPLMNGKKNFDGIALSQYPRRELMGYSIKIDNYRYTEWINKNNEIIDYELLNHSSSDVADQNIFKDLENDKKIFLNKSLELKRN